MQVIILSAGIGSRLRPHTNKIPKCLVKVANLSILEHQLKVFKSFGLYEKSISIVGGYLFNKLKNFSINLIENKRFAETNMVFSFFHGLKNIGLDDDIIISYGDIIFEEFILKKLLNCDYPISIVADKEWEKLWQLRMEDILSDAETFKYDLDKNISEIGRKPKTISDIDAQYIGLIKIKKEYLKKIFSIYKNLYSKKMNNIKDIDNMYMTEFIERLIKSKLPVKACLIEGGWLEVDTIKDLEIYNRLHRQKKLKKYCNLE